MSTRNSRAHVTLSRAAHHLQTIFLFTRSDYKTILFPVTLSAAAASPSAGLGDLAYTVTWIWFHLLQANVSNQTYSKHEDLVNKPWRPLPSGRINVHESRKLRWSLVVICLGLSSWFGRGVVFSSAALSVVEFIHDDLGFSHHPVYKNLCNVGGYLTFELGATLILSSKTSLDRVTFIALCMSGLIIFTTIHAQDFGDAEGDRISGRRTLPIVAPEGSRTYILAALPLWSLILPTIWDLGPLSSVIFIMMGAFVGVQYFRFRDAPHDELSYVLYNVCLRLVNFWASGN
ncbi:UbiA prenyltransferase family [Hygrophoropsis aurantiaca]|uniref:UbiA prenyltransferase family n=1 Tax=Hygrophoropsis aurantiaca TaxID=72124 RepID=A0ACB7ZUN9_9AGAM|nr:UbiA prenyltransferase family [Hygrophoropsis aurantiaca]